MVYAVTSGNVSIAMAPSPLMLTGTLNNASNYIAGLSDSLNYSFTYTNNSNVTLLNTVLTAKFTGSMFDFGTLRSNASFSSITDTVTWNGANTPGLASIAPGQSGSVTVAVRTKPSFPIRLLSDKNYGLKVHAVIDSPTVPPGIAASSHHLDGRPGGQGWGRGSLECSRLLQRSDGGHPEFGALSAEGRCEHGVYYPLANHGLFRQILPTCPFPRIFNQEPPARAGSRAT